jgi:predicted secreted protein
MQIGSWIAVYFVTWWICLFVVLPFGAHSQRDAGAIVPGTEPGAPALFRAWPKVLATSLIAAVVTTFVLWLTGTGILDAYLR